MLSSSPSIGQAVVSAPSNISSEIRLAGLTVPGDISLLGFDDIRYAGIMEPPLTTIRQPATEIGQRVMYRLLNEIEDGRGGQAESEIVPHKLIIRQSTAPPRG